MYLILIFYVQICEKYCLDEYVKASLHAFIINTLKMHSNEINTNSKVNFIYYFLKKHILYSN